MSSHIESFEGCVLDIATGLGGMFEALLKSEADFTPVASDADPNVIAWTAGQMRQDYTREFGSLAEMHRVL